MNTPRTSAFHRWAQVFSLCSVFVALAPAGEAATYHVSTKGADTAGGSKAEPWRTIQHAADSLQPGDTALIAAGTYLEKVTISKGGTAEHGPIALQAEGAVIVSGKGIKGQNIFHIKDASHVRLIGFEIRDNLKVDDGSGIRVEGACSQIEIKNCRIHEIRGKDAMGITVYGTNPTTAISQLLIQGCEVYGCDPAESEALTLNGNIDGFQILNNVVRDVNNIGICMIGGEDWINSDRTKVTRNGLCKGNKVSRIRASYGDGYAAGIYVDGGSDIIVEENDITECNLGIEVGAENKGTIARRIVVRNNRVWKNQKTGIVFGGYEGKAGRVEDCLIEGNVCYHNDTHDDRNGELWIQWASHNVVKGNVFWAGEEAMLLQCIAEARDNTLNGNIWYTEAGADEANFTWLGRELTGFEAYRRFSKQDSSSKFQKPKVKSLSSN
ncbi:parallel beta helix pectate lyase-like protein [Roseimicrobium gellanilyticum]|uniref:Parallel beta helix pectate lyase-like protein n=1 Tax=Roseimicrobium gellanilyticum TaxID=748857 RepID=A0A366HIZ9_9BACT|nr:right-handed parallel beta-helix repeat-containing protein [Roseimicrobium gellanilyticum]RBP42345.1 parallel beta helix pectate lyase-like protein [Roseimicrobium gellanilyticum]